MDGDALTAADLHLEDHDDDDSNTEYTDDGSFLENSSLKKMVRNSLQMLDSLTDEVNEITQDGNGKRKGRTTAATDDDDAPTPMTVTPSSAGSSSEMNDKNGAGGSLKDMTISVSFESSGGNNSTRGSKRNNGSSNPPTTSPLVSPLHAASTLKDMDGAAQMPFLEDSLKTGRGKSDQNDGGENAEDDELSLDDSLANELLAIKEVALELERELQSADIHAVQEAIERIANSQDPKVQGVLETEDKEIIRKALDDEIRKNEPQNVVLRYLYMAAMNTLTRDETTHLLVAVVVIVWALVFSTVYHVLTFDLV